MSINIVVPEVGESIVDARVARWLKKEGDAVAAGEPLVELETDKIDVEVPAPKAGVLERIAHKDGDDVKIGAVIGTIKEGAARDGAAQGRGRGGFRDGSCASAPAATESGTGRAVETGAGDALRAQARARAERRDRRRESRRAEGHAQRRRESRVAGRSARCRRGTSNRASGGACRAPSDPARGACRTSSGSARGAAIHAGAER